MGEDRLVTIPNLLSVVRIVLLPVFLWALLRSQHRRYGRHPERLGVLALVLGLAGWLEV